MSTERSILVIDDEPAVRRLLRLTLEPQGYQIHEAGNGQLGLQEAAARRPDVIILDLGLPDMDGVAVLKRLREWSKTPVLVLSVRDREADKVAALDNGADDYLTKPFSFSELSARVRALLRRPPNPLGVVLRVEELELDRAERVVRRAGRRIDLTPREFALLEYLMRNAGRCVTRAMIIEHVWNFSFDTMTNVVDVYINYLRKKIDQDFESKLIHTVRNVGYELGKEG